MADVSGSDAGWRFGSGRVRLHAAALHRGAVATLLATCAIFAATAGLASLAEMRPKAPPAALAIAVDGADLLLAPDVSGATVVFAGDRRLGLLRGHAAPIVSAVLAAEGDALITLDAQGQLRRTDLAALQAASAADVAPLAAAFVADLWDPYGAPAARAVAGLPWRPAETGWMAALASALLAFGAFATPQALAFAGRLWPKPPEPQPAGAAAPPAFQPPRTPGARWREPIPGLPENALPDMVTIPAGRFLMGAAEGEEGASSDEYPQHEVTIPARFALGRTPVTFSQWDAAIAAGAKLPKPADQGWGRGDRPVISVSWEDAQAYVAWLNDALGLAGPARYRLPSEAEWEYACRAGSQTRFSFGDDDAQLGDYAWFRGNADRKTHPVAAKAPNAFGLYDMHGNVWEWCEDSFQDNYEGAPSDGTAWIGKESSNRVLRGGSWYDYAQFLRSAYRVGSTPTGRNVSVGFRLARTL